MFNTQMTLQKRLSIGVSNGHKIIVVKQGRFGEPILWSVVTIICVLKGTAYLYSADGRFVGFASLPIPDIASVYGWVFLAILCSLMGLWYAMAYEAITAVGSEVRIQVRLGKKAYLSSQTYLIANIENLRLCRYVVLKSGVVYWRACFDYKGKKKELETRCYTKEDGRYFLDYCLKPILSSAEFGTPSD
jgi:hypothetical protein